MAKYGRILVCEGVFKKDEHGLNIIICLVNKIYE